MQVNDGGITATIQQFLQLSGLGHSTAYGLINSGVLDTITIGRRRLVVLDSWRREVARRLAGPQEDARRNQTVPSLGSAVTREAPQPEEALQPKRRRGRPRKAAQLEDDEPTALSLGRSR
jgi:hypothetical protein